MSFRVAGLCSGAGMLEYAAHQLGGETVLMCEFAEFPRRILSRRYSGVPIVEDVREVSGREVEADVLVFGFPCQDISSAGRGEGIGGERSGLWKECFRVLSEMRPSIALIENVDALLRRGLDVVLTDLRSIGYHLEWDIIPAAAVGAPHLRQRFFGVARPAELAAEPVYGDVLYDRHGERVTFELTGKLPRAGRMGAENVALEPIAPRKTKRHDGWSHWVGVDLLGVGKNFLLPSPTATMGERGGDLLQVVRGNQSPSGHFASGRLWPTLHGVAREDYSRPQGPSGNELGRAINRSLWPTATARDHKDVGEGRYGRGQLPEAVREQALWPTPQKVDGDGGRVEPSLNQLRPSGSKRSISLNSAIALKGSPLLPTPTANDDGKTPEAHMAMKSRLPGGARKTITSLAVPSRNGFEQPESGLWPTATARLGESRGAQAKRFLDPARSNDLDDAVAYRTIKNRGSLNPTWVEHIMAMPLYWTDPDFSNELVVSVPWWFEPPGVPRVEVGVRYRADRLRAIGNSVVHPCAMIALSRALEATSGRWNLSAGSQLAA